MEDRIKEVMKRDEVGKREALHILEKDDDERRRWGLKLYGTDTWDSRLYDMVILIDRLSVEDAVQLLVATIQKPVFQTTKASQKRLNDEVLCARIHATLVNISLMIEVSADDGMVTLGNISEVLYSDAAIRTKIEKIVKDIDGVKEIQFAEKPPSSTDHVNPFHNIE